MVHLHHHNLCENYVSIFENAVVRIFVSIRFVETKAYYCSDFNAKTRL